MEAPKRATKFAANDEWGKIYRNLFGVAKMNQSLSILTGASAGATESFVVVPFELVKIRLQDRAQASKYNGMIDCVTKIVRQEGLLTLYQGLESTMWRHILWNSGYFGCIFQVRELLPANPTKDKSIQMRNDIISGTIGGTVGTILNTPMDVVKSRIQNSTKTVGTVPKYNWAWPALGTVMKEEGFGALYKGFIPKVLRLGPGGGILLVVFTGVMVSLLHVNGRAASTNLPTGFLQKDARRHRVRFSREVTHEHTRWAIDCIELGDALHDCSRWHASLAAVYS